MWWSIGIFNKTIWRSRFKLPPGELDAEEVHTRNQSSSHIGKVRFSKRWEAKGKHFPFQPCISSHHGHQQNFTLTWKCSELEQKWRIEIPSIKPSRMFLGQCSLLMEQYRLLFRCDDILNLNTTFEIEIKSQRCRWKLWEVDSERWIRRGVYIRNMSNTLLLRTSNEPLPRSSLSFSKRTTSLAK